MLSLALLHRRDATETKKPKLQLLTAVRSTKYAAKPWLLCCIAFVLADECVATETTPDQAAETTLPLLVAVLSVAAVRLEAVADSTARLVVQLLNVPYVTFGLMMLPLGMHQHYAGNSNRPEPQAPMQVDKALRVMAGWSQK